VLDWRLDRIDGLTVARCGPLTAAGWAHAFSTRAADGRADFDLSPGSHSLPARAGRLLAAAGVAGAAPSGQRQVHGDRVLPAGEADGAEADGLLWLRGDPVDPVPGVRTADCVPILLAARSGRAAAAVHAGWRGTAAGIAGRAVAALAAAGVGAADLVAAVGPAIGPCCYEVGDEVVRALGAPAGGPTVDLRALNRALLEAAGVPRSAIHLAPWCTRCRPDLFFSHRRDGEAAGRMLSVIGPPVS
jgi:YfiH family protein